MRLSTTLILAVSPLFSLADQQPKAWLFETSSGRAEGVGTRSCQRFYLKKQENWNLNLKTLNKSKRSPQGWGEPNPKLGGGWGPDVAAPSGPGTFQPYSPVQNAPTWTPPPSAGPKLPAQQPKPNNNNNNGGWGQPPPPKPNNNNNNNGGWEQAPLPNTNNNGGGWGQPPPPKPNNNNNGWGQPPPKTSPPGGNNNGNWNGPTPPPKPNGGPPQHNDGGPPHSNNGGPPQTNNGGPPQNINGGSPPKNNGGPPANNSSGNWNGPTAPPKVLKCCLRLYLDENCKDREAEECVEDVGGKEHEGGLSKDDYRSFNILCT